MTKEDLIKELSNTNVLKTPEIISAINEVDRADFVLPQYGDAAYENYALPIGFGQTISQPLTVVFMLEQLQPMSGDKILDIGAGSGWQTALLSHIVGPQGKVVAIERIEQLLEMASKNISKYTNKVRMLLGNAAKGYRKEAPFDKIIAAAAGDEIPQAWKDQVKVGGKIVAPVKNSIIVLEKYAPGKFHTVEYEGFAFVPLVRD